mgnify:CR=1 FL=1
MMSVEIYYQTFTLKRMPHAADAVCAKEQMRDISKRCFL